MNGEDPNHHNKNKRSRKPMSPKQKGAIKIVALCLVCALLGGLAQPIYSSLSGGNETTIYTGDRTPTQVDTASVDTSKELTTAEIYAKYVNSCVGITVDIVSTNVFGQTVTGGRRWFRLRASPKTATSSPTTTSSRTGPRPPW